MLNDWEYLRIRVVTHYPATTLRGLHKKINNKKKNQFGDVDEIFILVENRLGNFNFLA